MRDIAFISAGKAGLCRSVLDGLPEWFGLPEAKDAYVDGAANAPMLACRLGGDNPDPNYIVTRRFYEAVGFLPLEVFATLWDEGNPCLLMVRPVGM